MKLEVDFIKKVSYNLYYFSSRGGFLYSGRNPPSSTFLSKVLFVTSRKNNLKIKRTFNEEETKGLLSSGISGISSLRKKMITQILDIGSRPIREVMTPRTLVKGIEMHETREKILETVLSAGFTRFPVYRSRLDNIEGILHARDIIPYLIDNKDFNIKAVLRKAFFVPESASLEKALLQMQENTIHLAVVVDEFGSMEGIVTLEDIIEEIVGDIRDEYDAQAEEFLTPQKEGAYLVKGSASINDIDSRFSLDLPEKKTFTTLAGFFLHEFGRIPRENDSLEFRGLTFTVVKMNRRHISLIKIRPQGPAGIP